MGRPKGSKNKPKAEAAAGDLAGTAPKTVEDMTDEQRQVLFFDWKKRYEAALGKKKEADAAFKNVCKQARAELGSSAVLDIKDAIALADDGENAEEALRAEIERKLRVARWMGAELGAQFDMFGADPQPNRTPAVDKAFEDGKRAGLQGADMVSPHAPSTPQGQSWIRGYHKGSAIRRKTDEEIAEAPAEVVTSLNDRRGGAAPIGTAEATHRIAAA